MHSLLQGLSLPDDHFSLTVTQRHICHFSNKHFWLMKSKLYVAVAHTLMSFQQGSWWLFKTSCASLWLLSPAHLGWWQWSQPLIPGTVTLHIPLPSLGSGTGGTLGQQTNSSASEVPRPSKASGPACNGHSQIWPGYEMGSHLSCLLGAVGLWTGVFPLHWDAV